MIKQEITQYYEIEKRQIYELLRDQLVGFKAEEYNELIWGRDVYMPYKNVYILGKDLADAVNRVRSNWENDLEITLSVLVSIGLLKDGYYLVHWRQDYP